MTKILVSAAMIAACSVALAKLPPPDDATKAKAAEAAAKAAWQGKIDGYLLCKSQDKVAASYKKTGKATPTPAAAGAVASITASATAAAARQPSAAAVATAAPCADPGPFAYTPPEQKPIEASGAHSPPGTAVSPPSTKTPAAVIAPAKKS